MEKEEEDRKREGCRDKETRDKLGLWRRRVGELYPYPVLKMNHTLVACAEYVMAVRL